MSIVVLSSGGVDSTLMAVLATKRDVRVHPLFVNYGQHAATQEWKACRRVLRQLDLPRPSAMDLRGYGALIPSGLTRKELRVKEDAFLPGRNLLFLLAGCAFARSIDANAVAIGLLNEDFSLFPDQTAGFLKLAHAAISQSCGSRIDIIAPLMEMNKADVLVLAAAHNIRSTYSCHAGTSRPCRKCVSCLELQHARQELKRREE